MPRTKIVVSPAALGGRKKPFHVNVSASTTSYQVVAKVLEKLESRDPPLRYQLWATNSEREQSLRDDEPPAAVREKWAGQGAEPQFQLRLRASGIIRVQHRLTGDQETFLSLIVTPHTTSCDVLQVALAKISPQDLPTNYLLIEKTPHGERVIGDEECPLLLQTGATQLLLRHTQPPTHTLSSTSPDLSPTELPHSPLSSISSPSHTPSVLSVQRSWLSMHHDLISSLSQFTSALQQHGTETGDGNGSRTRILERSLVQQNQVVDMLQKMVVSLENENERVREKGVGLERRVQALKMWKMRARLAEERLKEMAESCGILGSSKDGIVSFSALAGFEKLLVQKDEKIASLQSRVEGDEEEKGGSETRSVNLRAKLAEERVRVLELEEELLSFRQESRKALRELSDAQSDMARRESEVHYLRHEVETVRRVETQQQEVVMGLRAALLDRDAQIASLTRALERTTAERERRMSAPVRQRQSIFDLLLGREVFNIKLGRRSDGDNLGFSVSRFEMPISSRSSSLIVTAVKEGSQAQGLLLPGDEILEVNGVNCRSLVSQRKAVEILEGAGGSLKIVAARENGPADVVGRLRSTPVIPDSSHSALWTTANDASFSPISPHLPSNNVAPSSSPRHYKLTLSSSPSSSSSPYTLPLASQIRPQPIGQGKVLEPVSPEHLEKPTSNTSRAASSKNNSVDEGLRLRQDELEEELDTVHGEIENLKTENQLSVAQNFDLQQKLKTSEREMADLRREAEEVQELVTGLREKLEREEERVGRLEHQNSSLQEKLSEANSERDSEKQRVSHTREEIVRLKLEFEREKSELATELSTVRSRNEQLEDEVKSQLAKAAAVQSHASQQETLRDTEQKEGEKLVQQLTNGLQELRESSAKEVSSLQLEVEQLRGQLNTMIPQVEAAGKRETEMKHELRHLRQVASETNKQLTELDKAHRSLKGKMADIREQAESKTLECESLTLGIKRAEGKLQANKNVSRRQQEEIDNVRRKNNSLLVERVKADEERGRTELALKKCRTVLASLRDQLEKQSEEKDLFSELETLVAENTALQQQLESSREKTERLCRQLGGVQEQLDKARDSLQTTGGERDELKTELSLQQSKVEELKKSLAASEAALEVAEGGKKKSKDLVSSMTFVHEQDTAKIRELEETVATAQRGLGEIRLEATRVQEEMGRELQQLGAECAGLRQRAKGLSDQLDSEREGRAGDVKSLREALQTSEQSVCHLQSELQARESANSINQATIAQLQTTCEQTEQEKARLEGSLEEVLQQNRQLAEEAEKLRSSVRQLETDNAALTGERQSLIESCTEVKSSLAQSSGKVESLTARLETALTELSQTQERFESKHREGQEAKKSRNELEDKYRENEKRCEGAESKVQEVTLSLHTREEEVSRLRTQLEVSESAQTQLQRSVAFLQSTTASQEKKIKVLEGERTNLASAVEQLKASQAMLKEVVYSLESEKAQNEGTKNREIESLTHQLEEKVEAEREHLGKIQQFERKWRESQRTTEELQEALRASLTSLGDKREGEVVRQLVSLESSLVATQHEASEAKTTEEALRKELSKTVEESELASAKCSQLQEELEGLREEMAERRETIARLAELNEKVGVLEKSQKERSDKIMAAESQLEATSRELQVVKTENAALLERVGEVAAVSLSLAETTAQLEKVRGGLATEGKLRREAVEEKEQLLGVLRRLEVEKHTVSLAPSPEASSEWQEADREKLLSLTREREEEATRLREYVSKLLSAVVEKAPFLLEKLSD